MRAKLNLEIVSAIKRMAAERDKFGRGVYTYPMIRKDIFISFGINIGTESIARVVRGDTWTNEGLAQVMLPEGEKASEDKLDELLEKAKKGEVDEKITSLLAKYKR